MKQWLGMILCLALLAGCLPAWAAEDVFTVRDLSGAHDGAADAAYIAAHLTSDRSYLRLDISLEEECQVNVSIRGEDGALTYQRDYGLCAGHFRTEDIYLRLTDQKTTYQVTARVGDYTYTFPLQRVMPRLQGNDACSVGYPLAALSGGSSWKTVTILDLAALEGSGKTVALHASNAYTLGSVVFSVSGGRLKVTAALDEGIDGEIDKATVYVATNALEAQTLGKKGFTGVSCGLGDGVNISGADYAAVYVKLTVSFDPAGVPSSPETTLPGQDALWQTMLTHTANEAVG